ncbi:MAG TPA: caspase family protein [Vicinamibacterales bacterium]|nr:caspase family protein [Vicinamibacterales bacterium]
MRSLAFSNDGHLLYSAGADGSVRMWDLHARCELRTVLRRPTAITSLRLSSDGRTLTAGDATGAVTQLQIPGGGIKRETNATAVTSGRNLVVVDAVTSRTIVTIDAGASPAERSIESFAFSADGRTVAAGFSDGTISGWDIATGRQAWSFAPVISPVRVAALINGGFASADETESLVHVWDFERGGPAHSLPVGNRVTYAIQSAGKYWLATAGGDESGQRRPRAVEVWDILTGARVAHFEVVCGRVRDLTFDLLDKYLAATTSEDEVVVWDFREGRRVATIVPAKHVMGFETFGRNSVTTANPSGEAEVWELPGGRFLKRLRNPARPLRIVEEGARSLWESRDGALTLLGSTSDDMRRFTSHHMPVVRVESDQKVLVAASADGEITAWDYVTTTMLWSRRVHAGEVSQIAITGNNVLSTGSDGMIRVTDARSGAELLSIVLLRGGRDWIAATPDGLFDGTTEGMQHAAWYSRGQTFPIDQFLADFYQPGLIADVLAGERPHAPVDLTAFVGIPGLRDMLLQKLARLDVRNGKRVLCFDTVPGVPLSVPAGEPDIGQRAGAYHIEPGDATCKYQYDLGSAVRETPPARVTRSTPLATLLATGATLHVFCVGVSDYPASSGFEKLPYAVPSAKAIEQAYIKMAASHQYAYASVRVWPSLLDGAATRNEIRARLSDISRELGPEDIVILYFAGHGGAPRGQEMFAFASADARESDFARTGLTTPMLVDALREIRASVVIMIDACQAGAAAESLARFGEARVRRSGLDCVLCHAAGAHVLAATLPFAYAVQLAGNRSALATALLEEFDQPDIQWLKLSALIDHVRQRLPAISEAKVGFRQVPLAVSVGDDFVIFSMR